MIQYSFIDTPIGQLGVYTVKEGVVFVSLPGKKHTDVLEWCSKNLGEEDSVHSTEWCSEAITQIQEFLQGKRDIIDCNFLLVTSSFRRKALKEIRNIPYGETRTYGQVAEMVNNPRASRAVGTANSTNPLPLIIPCHRVHASDGIGGYGGRPDIKQWLLDLEQNNS